MRRMMIFHQIFSTVYGIIIYIFHLYLRLCYIMQLPAALRNNGAKYNFIAQSFSESERFLRPAGRRCKQSALDSLTALPSSPSGNGHLGTPRSTAICQFDQLESANVRTKASNSSRRRLEY